MSRRRIGSEASVVVTVRMAGEEYERLVGMSDEQNPVRDLIREAVREYMEKYGKVENG